MSRPTGGYVKLHRKILNSWVSDDPIAFTMLGILVMWANRLAGTVSLHRQMKPLQRGQVATSDGELAAKLRVDRKTVRRKLEHMETDGILDIRRDNCGTIITICNYEKYQDDKSEDGTAEGIADGTAEGTAKGTHKETYKPRNLDITPHTPRKRGEGSKGLAKLIVARLLSTPDLRLHSFDSLFDDPRSVAVLNKRFPEGMLQLMDYWHRRTNKSPVGVVQAQLRDDLAALLSADSTPKGGQGAPKPGCVD